MTTSARWTCIISFLVILLVPVTGRAQDHFTDCIDSDVNDATVVIPSDTALTYPDGEPLRTGDEVALFSDDGRCAGVAVWDSSKTALSLSVADLDSTAGVLDGYNPRETLKYRVWRASDNEEYEVSSSTYACTLPHCRSDGTYERNALYEVSKLKPSSEPRLQLSEWTATERSTGIVLQWRVEDATDVTGFRLEHRADTVETWSKLAFIDAAGPTSSSQDYQYETKNLDYGSHRFRLSQIHRDGSKSTSRSLKVSHTLKSTHDVSKVYPNPVRENGTLKLTVKDPQNIVVRLYDILGRRQAVLLDRRIPGNQTETVHLDFQQTSSGQYFLQVEGKDFQLTRRVVVVR